MGHTISHGVRPAKERVDNILSAKCPRNKMELKSFIGLMAYNETFLPTITSVLHPLYCSTLAAAQMLWWALILSAYSYKIRYKPESAYHDYLPHPQSVLPVSAGDIARVTERDSTLAVVLQQVHLGRWPVQPNDGLIPFYRRWMELSCHDGSLLWGQ